MANLTENLTSIFHGVPMASGDEVAATVRA